MMTEWAQEEHLTPVSDTHTHSANSSHSEGISLAGWNWDHVKVKLVIVLFIISSGIAKLIFHKAHWLSSRVPESCLLIILGIMFGGCLYEADGERRDVKAGDKVLPEFTSDLFFFYLLPPIILEASWSLYNSNFFSNIRSILLFAVAGTVINFLLIGALLLAVCDAGLVSTTDMTPIQIFLYASLISAVDPVAVLSIFAEVGVNPHLYFLVFGESLLNDGVAVVLYKMMTAFAGMEHRGEQITLSHIMIGCGSFLTVALGGLAIGVVYGLLTSLLTRATKGVRIIEPLALFCGGYLAYVTAELVHWSGIISLIGCGLVQAHYAFKNISAESRITVNYFIKMLSSTSDCIIFLYLGMSWFTNNHVWDSGFIMWSIVFTLLVRFVSTYVLAALVNWLRGHIHPITYSEMFVMAYGGLRGAVGFSLVITINPEHVPHSFMMVTTTLVIIMQTVFLQGGTIKWIVNFLGIEKSSSSGELSLMSEMNGKLFEHIMAGVECVSGKHGQYYFQDLWNRMDEKYLTRIFVSSDADHEMVRIYDEVSIGDHYMHLYGPSINAVETFKDMMKGHDNETFEFEDKRVNNGKDVEQRIEMLDESTKISYQNSLKLALNENPVNKLHQVVDKNLCRVEELDVTYHLHKRKRSAKHIRQRFISGPADASNVKPHDVPHDYDRAVSADTGVEILKAKHQEFRRRKISHNKKSKCEDKSDESTTGL